MTRMQIKQRRTGAAAAAATGCIVGAIVAALLPEFDPDAFKTTLAVIGAVAASYALCRVIFWLDGERDV